MVGEAYGTFKPPRHRAEMNWGTRTATCLAGVCGLAALFAQGGRFSDFFDVFTHFAPLYLVGSIAALVVLVVRRSPFWTLFLGLAAALSSLLLMSPEFIKIKPPAAAEPLGEELKVVQFNLNGDERWNSRVVAWLAKEDPDVIVLDDLSPNLRNAISQKFPGRHLVCPHRCSVALISKVRPTHTDTFLGGRYGLTPAIALARFGDGKNSFVVVGTHLAKPYVKGPDSMSTYTGVQDENTRRLRGFLKAYPQQSLILVGDFNSTPWSFNFQREEAQLGLDRRTRFVFTWPANPTNIAFLPIDHVYAGADWRTVSVTRGPRLGSDHYPVVAVLERRPDIAVRTISSKPQ